MIMEEEWREGIWREGVWQMDVTATVISIEDIG
jgi:hypothetical protein